MTIPFFGSGKGAGNLPAPSSLISLQNAVVLIIDFLRFLRLMRLLWFLRFLWRMRLLRFRKTIIFRIILHRF